MREPKGGILTVLEEDEVDVEVDKLLLLLWAEEELVALLLELPLLLW